MDVFAQQSFASGGGWREVTPVAPQWAARLCILLVEDDEGDAYLIKRALARNARVGEIVLAENGVEALDVIDRGIVRPDLALIDLHMPCKDGFALLRDLSTRESRQFPSVVLTSSRARADALRSMQRGAMDFVTKPSTEVKLVAALDRVIAQI
jgi:CheY-like chemotaxis protein